MNIQLEMEDELAARVMSALAEQGEDDESRVHRAVMFAAAQAEFGKQRDYIMRQAEGEVERVRVEVNKFYGLE